jgi:aldehyde dehydrogenase (NAD+)
MATLAPEMVTPLHRDRVAGSQVISAAEQLSCARIAQSAWGATPLKQRLAVTKEARHLIAASCRELATSVSSQSRNIADTLVAEVLPLAEACRFLEHEAASILRPVNLGRRGRPFWLSGVEAEVHRVPLGTVLIIAPSNYPLFLPGVQALQALVAGNAVLWKPAAGGATAARTFARILKLAGLPDGVLCILDESVDSGVDAIHAGVDKVFLTGHVDTGRAVMRELAETATPCVMELSGCDAVFVLPGADLERAAHALAFGMRLNGSATCMAPRRVFASQAIADDLIARLLPMLATIEPTIITSRAHNLLDAVLLDAQRRGARILIDGRAGFSDAVTPTVVTNAPRDASILRTDIFAPVLTFVLAPDEEAAMAANARCPYALTAAIFGPEPVARQMAQKLRAGVVLMNDLIVSTADPRVSFGGRGDSGFGVTRGREGLLEMTAVKTILAQKSKSLRAYAATTDKHEPFFASYIEAVHSRSPGARFKGLRSLLAAAKRLKNE